MLAREAVQPSTRGFPVRRRATAGVVFITMLVPVGIAYAVTSVDAYLDEHSVDWTP